MESTAIKLFPRDKLREWAKAADLDHALLHNMIAAILESDCNIGLFCYCKLGCEAMLETQESKWIQQRHWTAEEATPEEAVRSAIRMAIAEPPPPPQPHGDQ